MSKHLYRIAPLVLLLFGVVAMLRARDLSLGQLDAPGPGLWPFIVAGLLTLTALVLLFIDDPADYEPWTRGTAGIALGLLSLGAFIVLFEKIGFLIPAVLMLLIWLRLFAREPWRWAVPLAVIGAVVFHLVFVEALGVPFPDDIVLGG
ncbi:tripartite tricarboxylate transporter TctB family protein [Blastococcus goldschmidtiae]|uniref:Tripartite tricarboxylate transporter TctB family protein n=1 Tax=Blastococcus goldschmidtiae TaxID=3075546 RepID=A0ABU2KB53_9ACTN|nr:tripartite tricarboxylate transporter TctB family protein [Blastococcus sp. DSM 46792]MDT0277407.1 tripartite tricarboxylate transporter TctB family protein [Blastococcus sp. DSM 46792]